MVLSDLKKLFVPVRKKEAVKAAQGPLQFSFFSLNADCSAALAL